MDLDNGLNNNSIHNAVSNTQKLFVATILLCKVEGSTIDYKTELCHGIEFSVESFTRKIAASVLEKNTNYSIVDLKYCEVETATMLSVLVSQGLIVINEEAKNEYKH